MGELVAQRRVVEVPGGLGVAQNHATIKRRPALAGVGRVRDDRVGVQLRIAGAARAVAERRDDQPRAPQDLAAVGAPARERRLTLDVPERLADGVVVRAAHRAHGVLVSETEQHRNGLWRGERQVKPGDPRRTS